MLNAPPIASAGIRVGALDGALRPRVVGLAQSLVGPSWFAVLIETGEAHFGTESTSISGPTLAWRPWHLGARVTFSAGAVGTYVVLGSTALANAVGHMPETRELRETADLALNGPMPASGETFQAMRAAFHGLRRELESKAPAAHAVVDAYLRIVLVEVFRLGPKQGTGNERASPSQRVFAQFSSQVEAHFRDRWSVNDYAAALGVSRDRLGDVCRRARGMGPKDLIDRRIALEAKLHLENSSSSVQQVAGLLGFSSASQFNRFFRRLVGTPPGTYRAENLDGAGDGHSNPSRPYDWP